MNKRKNTLHPVSQSILLMGVFLFGLTGCSTPSPIEPTVVQITPTLISTTQTIPTTIVQETEPGTSKVAVTPAPSIKYAGVVIDADNASNLKPILQLDAFANTLAFSPDSRMAATAGIDRIIRLWSIPAGAELMQLIEPPDMGYLYSLAFSPDGSLLASGSGDHAIRIWDTTSGELVRKIEGHIYDVRAVTFSPDGKYLISGSKDQAIRIWNVEDGTSVWN